MRPAYDTESILDWTSPTQAHRKIMMLILVDTELIDSLLFSSLINTIIRRNEVIIITLLISRGKVVAENITSFISQILINNDLHIKTGRLILLTKSPYAAALFGDFLTANDVIFTIGGFLSYNIAPEFALVYETTPNHDVTKISSIGSSLHAINKISAIKGNQDWCCAQLKTEPNFLVIKLSGFKKIMEQYWRFPFKQTQKFSALSFLRNLGRFMCYLKPDWKQSLHL